MRKFRYLLPRAIVAVTLAFNAPIASSYVTPEDQRLIDAAGCDEIVKQYGIHAAQEKAAAEEVRRINSGTAATNVLGVATMAAFGIGFFTWDNGVSAEENLAELRAYREAIGAAGRKKGCAVPAK